ncbi:MAG: RNA methyltransferase [bacterium]
MNKDLMEMLKDKKRMKEEGLFTVDTEKILEEIINRGIEITDFIYCEEAAEVYTKYAHKLKAAPLVVRESYIQRFASVKNHQGFIAVAKAPVNTIKDLSKHERIIVLDNIQEPANLGALIRSGAAFGFRDFLLIDCAYLFNEKTIRASAGAVFSIKYKEAEEKDIKEIKNRQVIITDVGEGVRLKKALEKMEVPYALVFGNEGRGVSEPFREAATLKIKIEYPGKEIESLNVAASAAIIFYELTR